MKGRWYLFWGVAEEGGGGGSDRTGRGKEEGSFRLKERHRCVFTVLHHSFLLIGSSLTFLFLGF